MNSINDIFWRRSRLFWQVSSLITCCFLLASPKTSPASPRSDLEQCSNHLAGIFLAIQQYQHAHQQLPEQLSDLVPKFLAHTALLACPETQPALNGESLPDKGGRIARDAYVYELAPRPLTNALAQGLGMTQKSWRQLQMGRIGSELPMVRCMNHARILNLSFGGRIWESGPEWESELASVVRPEELSLEYLLREHVHLNVLRIPARESRALPEFVDLAPYFNGSLTGWLDGTEEQTLADFRTARLLTHGFSFEVRGVIQLGSRNFAMPAWPAFVTNIAVGMYCDGLAFLHGTVNGAAEGEEIGRYIVHFEDGLTNVVPITYGLHLLDWKDLDPKNVESWEKKQQAFTSRSIHAVEKGTTRLYVFHWTNPHPNLRVQSIDFVSAMTQSSPFLVAVSATRSSQIDEKAVRP